MNLWPEDEFEYPEKKFERGKVLNAQDLDKLETFARYEDKDGDGITYRTLPGTDHAKAAYFTRGTGHDDNAKYSEDNDNYRKLLDRLKKKYQALL